MPDSTERIHPATPYRRQVARREGRVARSRDLTAGGLLLAGLLVLLYCGDGISNQLGHLAIEKLSGQFSLSLDADAAVEQCRMILLRLAGPLLPLLGACVLVVVATNIGQVGFLFLPEKIQPDWNRVSPMRGLRRILSADNATMFLWGIIRVAAVSTVAAICVWNARLQLISLSYLSAISAATCLIELLLWTGIKVAATMLALGIVDYMIQWLRREQELKMTPEEMREEMRGQQGNAAVANRRRQIHQESLERAERAAA